MKFLFSISIILFFSLYYFSFKLIYLFIGGAGTIMLIGTEIGIIELSSSSVLV